MVLGLLQACPRRASEVAHRALDNDGWAGSAQQGWCRRLRYLLLPRARHAAQASEAQDGGVMTTPSEGFLEWHPVLNAGYTVGNTVVIIRKLVANESSFQDFDDLSNKFLYLFSYRVLISKKQRLSERITPSCMQWRFSSCPTIWPSSLFCWKN